MRAVTLTGRRADGRSALVDDDDYELIMQYRRHLRERARTREMISFGEPGRLSTLTTTY
jgi:hypothetical protein